MPRRSMLRFVPLLLLLVPFVVRPATAYPGASSRYVAGGAAVVRSAGEPVVDEGLVVCDNGDGAGAGGFCLPFGGGDAVAILDDAAGEDVAYQVCVDNNGDGACASPDPDPVCPDTIAFSHDDDGNFFNPLGPLPAGFTTGCPGGSWHGYVVFLCEGVHADAASGHSHAASTGTGSVTTGGEGLGTFCGGAPQRPSTKRYVLGSGNHTCGMSANNDPTIESGSMAASVYGGPWRVTDPAYGVVPVEIKCELKAGGGAIAAVAVGSGSAATVLPPTVVVYNAAPGAEVRLCTTVSWTASNGPETYRFDGDPATPGVQCALAIEVADPDTGYRSHFVLQTAV